MARRLLSLGCAIGLGLCASTCKHDHPSPAPTRASASADSATENTQRARFDSELRRAHARWQEQPDLGKCADIVKEKADLDLCTTAATALTTVEALDSAAAPSAVLPVLANASLALERLVERARYLSMEELGRRRLEGDAGAPASSASARALPPAVATPASGAVGMASPRGKQNSMRDRPKLKLSESPLTHLVQNAARLERDVLRNFAAYLEYAPLPVRQSAFDVAKRLAAEHPRWPTLSHTLREAAVLESDAALKQQLLETASRGLPPGPRPDQPTGSK